MRSVEAVNSRTTWTLPYNKPSTPSTMTCLFNDIPWLRVPPERRGDITVIPCLPQGRLLGGSGKPSKLAALAAARKKAQENKDKPEQQQNASIDLLDRLSLHSEKATSPQSPGESSSKRSLPGPEIPNRRYPRLKHAEVIQEPVARQTVPLPPAPTDRPVQLAQHELRTNPSAFASTMLGPQHELLSVGVGVFQLPQMQPQTSSNAFAGPSPDDIVKTAQEKGPGRG